MLAEGVGWVSYLVDSVGNSTNGTEAATLRDEIMDLMYIGQYRPFLCPMLERLRTYWDIGTELQGSALRSGITCFH